MMEQPDTPLTKSAMNNNNTGEIGFENRSKSSSNPRLVFRLVRQRNVLCAATVLLFLAFVVVVILLAFKSAADDASGAGCVDDGSGGSTSHRTRQKTCMSYNCLRMSSG